MSLNTVRKVMYVVHGIPPEKKGGTENYAINLALSVSRYCEVSIVHRTQNNQQDDYYTNTYNINDKIKAYSINNNYVSDNQYEAHYDNPKIDNIFENILLKEKPDIVHS